MRKKIALQAALLALLALIAGAPKANTGPRTPQVVASGPLEDPSCERHVLSVRLFEGEPSGHRLVGWLCALAPHDGQTVIIASPTGLADHSYWDWPADPETYSFVGHATRAGYAVFNYDRMGTGQSERPNAALVNLESEAYIVHQLVGMLRAGALGGTPFGSVVLLGNSFGSLLSIFEAEAYRDVDGLINTGVFVGPSPVGLAKLFAAFYPAQLDPKFADMDIPLGYATTQPGTRADFFYLPAAEPATVQLDEELKDTATVGEAATFPHWVPFTRIVGVPVLSLMGDHDLLFCLTVCEPGGPEAAKEPLFWSPQTCIEVEIVRDSGHFIQLHRGSAAESGVLIRDWLTRRVGVDVEHPPAEPCGGDVIGAGKEADRSSWE